MSYWCSLGYCCAVDTGFWLDCPSFLHFYKSFLARLLCLAGYWKGLVHQTSLVWGLYSLVIEGSSGRVLVHFSVCDCQGQMHGCDRTRGGRNKMLHQLQSHVFVCSVDSGSEHGCQAAVYVAFLFYWEMSSRAPVQKAEMIKILTW